MNIPSQHTPPAHNHNDNNWGELALNGFQQDTWFFVDIVSQIARYTDMDVVGGEWSKRASALDYEIQVSMDGTNWVQPVPIAVYIDGWTDAADADDYVARFFAPGGARFARLAGAVGDGHDRNTQIDAVIVMVPAPSSLAGLAIVGFVAAGRRRRG